MSLKCLDTIICCHYYYYTRTIRSNLLWYYTLNFQFVTPEIRNHINFNKSIQTMSVYPPQSVLLAVAQTPFAKIIISATFCLSENHNLGAFFNWNWDCIDGGRIKIIAIFHSSINYIFAMDRAISKFTHHKIRLELKVVI